VVCCDLVVDSSVAVCLGGVGELVYLWEECEGRVKMARTTPLEECARGEKGGNGNAHVDKNGEGNRHH
jgi:hypothetical protein